MPKLEETNPNAPTPQLTVSAPREHAGALLLSLPVLVVLQKQIPHEQIHNAVNGMSEGSVKWLSHVATRVIKNRFGRHANDVTVIVGAPTPFEHTPHALTNLALLYASIPIDEHDESAVHAARLIAEDFNVDDAIQSLREIVNAQGRGR